MKIAYLSLAVLFVVFAFVQINDPDPVLWILIYGATAVLCIFAAFKVYPKLPILLLLLIFTVYSFTFADGVLEWLAQGNKGMIFDDLAKMQYPFVEESREFLGLWICIIVLLTLLVPALRNKSAS